MCHNLTWPNRITLMRTSYAILKAATFVLVLVSGLEKMNARFLTLPSDGITLGLKTGFWFSVLAAIVCLMRGIPVIIEGVRLINKKETPVAANHPA
jgi:hypothetical protein